MSGPEAKPEAKPAAPAAKSGGSSVPPWGWILAIFLIVFSNIIVMVTGQLSGFLSMLRFNLGMVLIFLAIVYAFKAKKAAGG